MDLWSGVLRVKDIRDGIKHQGGFVVILVVFLVQCFPILADNIGIALGLGLAQGQGLRLAFGSICFFFLGLAFPLVGCLALALAVLLLLICPAY